ncbi:MAG: proline dehydrogenase family protein [Vicinamibacterales bacterium]|jgi:proline dehydrogenase|nr:proline dehydrogenase family protein [Vicinamibacterales bacterium]HJN42752.1 proline dehydrogenase family protein [Vicinamibacterales bacterium]
MLDSLSRAVFFRLAASPNVRQLASRYGMRAGGFARRFIAGETLEEAIETARELSARDLHCTLNYLGESVSSSAAARAAADTYAGMMRTVRDAGLTAQVSVKLTQLGLAIDQADCVTNLRQVLDAAGEQTFVRIDMEQSTWVDPTLDLFERFWQEGYRNVRVVLQSYLYRTERDLARINALGAGVRLCKGAYREPKTVAYPIKAEVNASFIRLMRAMMRDGTRPAFATHDPRMIDATCAYATERALPTRAVEFQMLYGVRRDLQATLRARGYRVRIYLPFGQQWFPYFMRRLGERPANALFVVRSLFHERPH